MFNLLVSRESFTNLQRWLDDARALGSSQLIVVLVGAKSDLEDEREVEWAEASRWASEHGSFTSPLASPPFSLNETLQKKTIDIHYLETSSLTDFQTELPFLFLTRSILLSIESGALDPEKSASGVSYGDRALRRVRSWGSRKGGNSRLSGLLVVGAEEGDGVKGWWRFRKNGRCCGG
jgi:GTPase SAR1 family protein